MMESVANMVNNILEGDGYVVIHDLLSPEDAEKARLLVLKRVEKEKEKTEEEKELKAEEQKELKKLVSDEQLKSDRLNGLVFEGEIFEQIVQHPTVIEIIEAILGEDMTLSALTAHILNPGSEKSMGVHVDYPYLIMKSPFPAYPVMGVQVIWMVEDFTQENGAPVFASGSQKFCTLPDSEQFRKTAEIVTGKAGSVVISHGLCWHKTSINSTNKPRVSILGNYNPKFVRPFKNPLFDEKSEVLKRGTNKLKQLLGLKLKDTFDQEIKRFNW